MYRKLKPLKGQCLRAGRPHFYTPGRASTVGLAWGGKLFIESAQPATCDQMAPGDCACFFFSVKHGPPHEGQGRELLVSIYLVEVLSKVLTLGIARDLLPRKRNAGL